MERSIRDKPHSFPKASLLFTTFFVKDDPMDTHKNVSDIATTQRILFDYKQCHSTSLQWSRCFLENDYRAVELVTGARALVHGDDGGEMRIAHVNVERHRRHRLVEDGVRANCKKITHSV